MKLGRGFARSTRVLWGIEKRVVRGMRRARRSNGGTIMAKMSY